MKDRGILIDADGDLKIGLQRGIGGVVVAGLTFGNTLFQNQYVLLKAHKGELKEYPALGVGLSDILHEYDLTGWTTDIRSQLEKDGMQVNRVVFDRDRNLVIDAEYEDQ